MAELTLDQLTEAARRRMIALERVADAANEALGRPPYSLRGTCTLLIVALDDLYNLDHELQEIQR